jgi:hypothetical protein
LAPAGGAYQFIQAEAASRLGLIQALGRTLNTSASPPQQLDQLWGTRLQGIRWDAHRASVQFELFWTDQGPEQFAALVLMGVRYSRFEFDELVEHDVVEFVSVEAEDCVLGIRLFGELSNGSFEFVCASFRVEQMEASGVA